MSLSGLISRCQSIILPGDASRKERSYFCRFQLLKVACILEADVTLTSSKLQLATEDFSHCTTLLLTFLSPASIFKDPYNYCQNSSNSKK